nr:MAG TPA: hypothetical protein [Caudoviricetes sp.]
MCLSLYRLLPHISSPLLGILENKQPAWVFILSAAASVLWSSFPQVIHRFSTGSI